MLEDGASAGGVGERRLEFGGLYLGGRVGGVGLGILLASRSYTVEFDELRRLVKHLTVTVTKRKGWLTSLSS